MTDTVERTQIDTVGDTSREVTMRRSTDNVQGMLAMIAEAARDPSVNAEKMTTLAELAMRLQDRQREEEFNKSLNAAIQGMPRITKHGRIVIPANQAKGTPERLQGTFAKFEDLDRVVRPVLSENQLAMFFEIGSIERAPGPEGGLMPLITARPIISHANGYTYRGEALPVPADTSGSKNAAQAMGSATSYAKRYAMCAALNIITVGEDDDGMAAVFAGKTAAADQDALRTEAEAAKAGGTYDEWYKAQSPQDRAWLVSSGIHKGNADPAQAARLVLDQFVKDVRNAPDQAALVALKKVTRPLLDKLEQGHPTMFAAAVLAYNTRRDELAPTRMTDDDALPY